MRQIKDIASIIGSGLTPSRNNNGFWIPGNFMWLKSDQLGEFIINNTNEKISETALKETGIKLWEKGTVSIALYGEGKTRGKVSILGEKMATNQAICNIVVDSDKADNFFLYYWIKYNYNNLRSLSSGVRKNLNSDDIKNFLFPDINIKKQISIREILSKIDRKIINNHKINDNLSFYSMIA